MDNTTLEYLIAMSERINLLIEHNNKLSRRIEVLEKNLVNNEFETDVQILIVEICIVIVVVLSIYLIYVMCRIFFGTYVPKYGEKYVDL